MVEFQSTIDTVVDSLQRTHHIEIGRASCRERVLRLV